MPKHDMLSVVLIRRAMLARAVDKSMKSAISQKHISVGIYFFTHRLRSEKSGDSFQESKMIYIF
jgi:hypothetical protein